MRAAFAILAALGVAACAAAPSAGPSRSAFLASETAFATRTCVQNGFAPAPVKAAMLARGYRALQITSNKDLQLTQPGVGALAAARFTASGQNPCAWYPGGSDGQAVMNAAAAELARLGYRETAERGVWTNGARKVRLTGQVIRNIGAGINSGSVSVSGAN